MRATTLLRRLLAFRGISVRRVRFTEDGKLVVPVAVRGHSRCGGCGRKGPVYDTRRPRRWRDLDVLGWLCYLEASVRRVSCQSCGKVVPERLPWADRGSRFTRRFEEQVAWLVQHCDKTTVSVDMRIAWRTVGAIVQRVVARHRRPVDLSRLEAIGVDELSYRKGHRYLTLITDLEGGGIIWSKEGKSAKTLEAFFDEIGPEACKRIRYVAIDMSEPYRKAIQDRLPNAKIVYDRFHVQQLVSRAVDKVRREEWRRLQGTQEGKGIKHTRWALLKSPWNVTPKEEGKLASLPKQNFRLYRAYLLKESFVEIYRGLYSVGWARVLICRWLAWACRSRLQPFVKVGRTIRKHLKGILGYFQTGYTNSTAEGLNTKARLATRQAYGFHSAAAVLAMIELRCTGIVIPLPHQP